MMMSRLFRYWLLCIALLTLAVFMASFYLEYMQGLTPCPLCVMQRGCVLLLLGLSLCAFYLGKHPKGRHIAMLQCMVALAGLYFASRQIWLQSLPEGQTPACLPSLDVLIRYFPWQDVLHALFWGAGDCAEVDWQWLGLPLSAWSALYFVAMLGISVVNICLFYGHRMQQKQRANRP